MGGGVPARPHARPDGCANRGHADLFEQFPEVKAKVDAGYRGLAKEFPGQVQAPPLRPKKDATPEEAAAWDAARHQQSSERICVEHANAEHKQWRTLQRFLGRREDSTRPTWPSPPGLRPRRREVITTGIRQASTTNGHVKGFGTSATIRSRSPSRSPPDASTGAFSSSLTTTVFSQRSMRRLEASLRRAAPKGHETFISRTASHQGLAPTSSPPRVQDTHRHPQAPMVAIWYRGALPGQMECSSHAGRTFDS